MLKSTRYVVQGVHDVDQEQIATMDVGNKKSVTTVIKWKSAKGIARLMCSVFKTVIEDFKQKSGKFHVIYFDIADASGSVEHKILYCKRKNS